MTLDASTREELYDLLDLLFDERIDNAAGDRLAKLLSDSDELQCIYIAEMNRHADLAWNWGVLSRCDSTSRLTDGTSRSRMPSGTVETSEGEILPSPFGSDAGGEGGELKAEGGRWKAEEANPPSPFPLPPSYPSHSLPYSLSSFLPTTPLGNVAFSYAMSAVLVAIGLFIFSLMSASSPHGAIVKDNPTDSRRRTTPNVPAPTPKIVSIARITGMDDCVWIDTDYAPFHDRVVQGDKFMLKSGLMEITYYTGAKVILQGPCSYEVESTVGGYLSLGKLTAKVEKKAEGIAKTEVPRPKTQDPLSSSHFPLLPSPLFTIKTPTAIVTDLGTEFGVEVKPDKSTDVCVFRGIVEATRDSRAGGTSVCERLVAGEAIRFGLSNTPPQRTTVKSLGGVPLSTPNRVRTIVSEARQSQLLAPTCLVASTYHRIWDADGKLLADSDRRLAFSVATDAEFGRGENGEGPRSSFDTFMGSGFGIQGSRDVGSPPSANPQSPIPKPSTAFVGLLYNHSVRIDRIKVYLGCQFADGGSWRQMPRVFILTKPIDPGSAPPESDPAHWRQLPLGQLSYGDPFDAKPDANPGKPLEWVLTGCRERDRIGYGWAVGGVAGDGDGNFVSITELRGYGADADAPASKKK